MIQFDSRPENKCRVFHNIILAILVRSKPIAMNKEVLSLPIIPNLARVNRMMPDLIRNTIAVGIHF